MTRPPQDESPTGVFAILGAGALVVLCCAGPVLLASGVLAGVGAALRNPWLIGIGAVVLAAAIAYTVSRIESHRGSHEVDACWPPPDRTGSTAPPATKRQTR